MKKLFFILISVLLSTSAFSQTDCEDYCATYNIPCPVGIACPNGRAVERLQVENHTNCRQYFVIFGGNGCGGCESQYYFSDIITIFPMSTLLLDSAAISGIGTGGSYTGAPHEFIAGARITTEHLYDSSCECVCGCTVGQHCCGATLTTFSFINNYPNCEECGSTTATWYPGECEEDAKLIFTP